MNDPANLITFLLAPVAAGTAFLDVYRIPLISFTLNSAPEIPETYHEGLLNWAAHLAYLKNDTEAFNPDKAKYYEDKFAEQFGPLPNARSERLRKTITMQAAMRPRQFGS
jgi:hypothetical protein